jgi:hypothetical protein
MTPLNACDLGGGAALSIWFRSVVSLGSVVDMALKWWHCTLPFFCFLLIKRVMPSSSSYFLITCLFVDISHAMHMTKDLRNRGEKSVLVKKG